VRWDCVKVGKVREAHDSLFASYRRRLSKTWQIFPYQIKDFDFSSTSEKTKENDSFPFMCLNFFWSSFVSHNLSTIFYGKITI
jgi:hypothetical protein